MSELEDIARRLIGEKAILDEAKVLHDQTREAAAGVLDPGDRKDLGLIEDRLLADQSAGDGFHLAHDFSVSRLANSARWAGFARSSS